MSNEAYLYNLRIRLLLPPVNLTGHQTTRHTCAKNDNILLSESRHAFHCFSCKACHKYTIVRHNRVRDALISFLESNITGAVTEYERMIYNPQDNDRHRRADFTLSIPNQPKTIIDVRISNTGSVSRLAIKPERVLLNGEEAKESLYLKTLGRALENPKLFIPFVMLTTGNIGKRGLEWIDEIGRRSKLGAEKFKTYLQRRLSITIANSLYSTANHFQKRFAPLQHAGPTGRQATLEW
jgi:hypothetical protein